MENFNRLNDLYFKKLLGDKKRKNLTLSFLNGILNKDDENCFTDITFLDKDNEPLTLDGKLSKLDIRADLNDGTQVDKKANINTAINLLKLGVDVDTIVKGTGLSIQDVEALKIKIK